MMNSLGSRFAASKPSWYCCSFDLAGQVIRFSALVWVVDNVRPLYTSEAPVLWWG